MSEQPVNLPSEAIVSEEVAPGIWGRLIRVLSKVHPAARLMLLVAGLAGFLLWLPAPMRDLIWRSLAARSLPSAMLLAFSLLALSLVWSAGQRLDVWVFEFFNLWGKRPVWLDRAMLATTQLGSGWAGLVIGLFLWGAGQRIAADGFILGTLTLWIVVELVKALVRRSRPFIVITHARVIGARAPGRSFPSGHTSQAFFMATLLVLYFNAGIWLALLLFTIALIVGITRMYVGAHYPRDVLAGAVLGIIWGVLAGMVL